MRWRFRGSTSKAEERQRKQIEARISAWWNAFERDAPRIDALFRRSEQWDLPRWMSEHLGGIDPSLMWEFGRALRAPGHRLVITPETDRQLRPLTNVILERAPALSGWEFYPYRLAEPVDQALHAVEARASVDFSDFRATVQVNQAAGVDLHFWSSKYDRMRSKRAVNAAFVATESLLGEEVLDNFVDVIEAGSEPVDGVDVDLGSLASTVAEQLAIARRRISPAPITERANLTGTLWKLKPIETPDAPRQEDLFVGKSTLPEMWLRAHSNDGFSSARFSSFGETFCYLKLDRSEGIEDEGFADKAEIEDAIDAALAPGKLGAHVGGGTGRRYSYIDLALIDVERSLPVIIDTLRCGRVPKRSWHLFFDDTLRDEWVGIWDETPPPP